MYIGNISFDTASDEILEHFGQWGQFTRSSSPICVKVRLIIPKYKGGSLNNLNDSR